MPIYEYKATGNAHCELCRDRFEVRQGMNDQPLDRCPQCGAEVKKLISRPFICLKESLDFGDTFDAYGEEDAYDLGLEEGFAEDQIW